MTGTAKAPFNHTGLTLLLAQRENLRRGQAALPAVVCSSPGHSVQLRCSRPSPGGRGRNISVSCQSNRWEQVTPEHNTPCSKVPALLGHQWITGSFKLGFPQREPNLQCPAGLAHLVFRTIREGIGPKILSIMARCSRLSCVWEREV